MPFTKEIDKVLRARRVDTDMLNVQEVLGYSNDKFQEAFDIALAMDNQNLAKLIYADFNTGKVIIEFTLLAKK